MKKNTKVLILVIVLIAIVALAYVLTSKNPSENNEANLNPDVSGELAGEDVNTDSDVEGEVEGEVELEEIEFNGYTDISVPDDFDWRDTVSDDGLEVEYMNEAEKAQMSIAPETRVQVLARDEESGVILAYKIIKTDEDIVTSNQE